MKKIGSFDGDVSIAFLAWKYVYMKQGQKENARASFIHSRSSAACDSRTSIS